MEIGRFSQKTIQIVESPDITNEGWEISAPLPYEGGRCIKTVVWSGEGHNFEFSARLGDWGFFKCKICGKKVKVRARKLDPRRYS